MDEVKLSVIVINYNLKDYIEQAVESILMQEIGYPYELLIGDDGSTDGSYELLVEKYGHGKYANVKIYRMPRDLSKWYLPVFRQARIIWSLLEKVKGQYVCILDGDDYYCDKDCFKRKIELLELEENKDCIICSSARLHDLNGKISKAKQPDSPIKIKAKKYLYKKGDQLNLAQCVFRASVLKYADVNAPELLGGDQLMLHFLLQYGDIYYIPYYDFVYRYRSNSNWNSKNRADIALEMTFFYSAIKRYKGDGFAKMWLRRRHLLYVLRNKEALQTERRWSVISEVANKYNLESFKYIMGEKVSLKTKIEMGIAIKVIGILDKIVDIVQYVKAVTIYLVDAQIPKEEKIKKIKNVVVKK